MVYFVQIFCPVAALLHNLSGRPAMATSIFEDGILTPVFISVSTVQNEVYILGTAVQFGGIYIFCFRTALCIAIQWRPDWRRSCPQPLYENRTPDEGNEVC